MDKDNECIISTIRTFIISLLTASKKFEEASQQVQEWKIKDWIPTV